MSIQLKKYSWIIAVIMIASIGLNLYLWKEKKETDQYWLSTNVRLLGSNVITANSNINSILNGDYQKNFQFGLATQRLIEGHIRAQQITC
ncbi:hypothetical protein [Ammoniphilus sp. 3BR4]|uniref:hypothetical protein n=1 Tax=Ammoniphilus sp. 3BR4 TaxID=3158265 RepID=UPI003467D86B